MSQGIFITFEGGEGVGKSTQIHLLAERLRAADYQVVTMREPGGTPIGEKIRNILLNPTHTELDAISELLLYEAARAQLVAERIVPALETGAVVLCDRYTDSTLAYQGVARGLGKELVQTANTIGSKGIKPQRTIVLMHDVEASLTNASKKGADRLEAEGVDFHTRVHEGFAEIAAAEPERVRTVSWQSAKEDTAALIFDEVSDLFPRAKDQSFEVTPELLKKIKGEK